MTSTVVDLSEESPERAKYRAITLHNIAGLPQAERLSDDQRFAIDVVSRVLPFKTNNYVVNELINWDDVPNDPIFTLTFPQQNMLRDDHFDEVARLVSQDASRADIDEAANRIRMTLNPHPAGQLEHNVPVLYEETVEGLQHKYEETVLLFPSNGQTCHAYCTFCFRWPQFVGLDDLKFATKQANGLVAYLKERPRVSDVLITGGDPMVMKTRRFKQYIDPILEEDPPNLRTIRIGTKALGYWPYRFTTDDDAEEMLDIFRRITATGRHLSIMAHFNHPRELSTPAVREATERIRETGAQIRTQSPIMRNINDNSDAWAEMWREQVRLGMIPYYMFVARDTGAKHFFEIPLVRAWEIFRGAYNQVSGLARTVRGPSMSAEPGKVAVSGPAEVAGQKVLTLSFLQGRDPDWVGRPFFAQYDESATWLNELRPAFGEEKFFFEDELAHRYEAGIGAGTEG
ncbi:MAG: lysine 2,3-aminomutase [Dehalococcoidia bacterium]|nr:lysine 2,3-aminomutase [Dehalococcoidia bacterium]MYD29730.1 lysine 2,3-aminomutase [Dehalococcoidia bacterium]